MNYKDLAIFPLTPLYFFMLIGHKLVFNSTINYIETAELYFSTKDLPVLVKEFQLLETGPVKMQMVWTILQADDS